MNHNEKKNQSTGTSSKVIQKMTLVDTDTELTVINIFYMFKKVQYKHVKERHGENKNDPN